MIIFKNKYDGLVNPDRSGTALRFILSLLRRTFYISTLRSPSQRYDAKSATFELVLAQEGLFCRGNFDFFSRTSIIFWNIICVNG